MTPCKQCKAETIALIDKEIEEKENELRKEEIYYKAQALTCDNSEDANDFLGTLAIEIEGLKRAISYITELKKKITSCEGNKGEK